MAHQPPTRPTTLADVIRAFPRRGDAPAFVQKTDFRTFRYSYADAYRLACKAANLLARQGVKRGDKVLIWGATGVPWAIAFLGCVLQGAVAVPLDVRARPETIKGIQAQVQAKLFIRTRYKQDPGIRVKTLYLEDLEQGLETLPDTPPRADIREDDLVEILYTSGTTGVPKGVMLTHRNILSNVQAVRQVEDLDPRDMFLSVLPLSHVFEQTAGFFFPLAVGASICYLRSMKASAIYRAFAREPITVMALVPKLLGTFRNTILSRAKEEGKEGALRAALAAAEHLPLALRKMLFRRVHARFRHLKYFIVGGAPLDPELERFWDAMGFLVLQGYGLTETSPIISCNAPRARKIGSVGKVLPGVDVAFKDGEIWVRGENVTQGYFKNPERNKECFERGWFKTGDLGRLDEDGFLFLHGRRKDMIKTSGGINVYPEDIERVLNATPGVKDACVVGLKHGVIEEVHAVLLLDPKRRREPRDIVHEANRKLDSAQQVHGFTLWPFEDFPRTTTMKVRKFVVLEHIQARHGKAGKTPPAGTPDVEERLLSILRQLVKEPGKIRAKATLGLDLRLGSIDRVELISLIEQEMNVDLEEDAITQATTVADLERMVQERKAVVERDHYRPWTRSPLFRVLRTVSQEVLWFPLTRWFCSPIHVQGMENLRGLEGPVVFVANHESHLDTPLVIASLPLPYHTYIAPAAWEEYFEAPKGAWLQRLKLGLLYDFVTLDFNVYRFPQTKGFFRAMRYTGELLDDGWSILLFPEGERSLTGRMRPFKQGIGLIAREMKVPIVPIRLDGLLERLPAGRFWPRRGPTSVAFGKPLIFTSESQVEIVKAVEQAIAGLPSALPDDGKEAHVEAPRGGWHGGHA